MTFAVHIRMLVISAVLLGATTGTSAAQQWTGPDNSERTIWRSGNVAIGPAISRDEIQALLELQRPLGDQQLLFSAKSSFRDMTAAVLELDTSRAYVGGARAKASLMPSGVFDLAVGRGAVIGLNNLDERLPSDVRLAVAGKILAEEVQVKLAKDWPDYVFDRGYSLSSLPELEDYINTHRHLPGMPSATEVEGNGLDLGEMQSKLLLKIEELTLHVIEQHKAIETLQRKLASLERNPGPRPAPHPE